MLVILYCRVYIKLRSALFVQYVADINVGVEPVLLRQNIFNFQFHIQYRFLWK